MKDVFSFFKATFTLASGAVTAVTLGCSSTQCTPSSTQLCSMVANTNLPLGCYVGTLYQKSGTSTFTKTICAPIANTATPANPPYLPATFCRVNIINSW